MTIYLDVLVLLNLFVTWFLLLSVQKLMGIEKKTGRMLIAACLGGIYSLVILLPPSLAGVLALCKIPMSGVLVGIAFGFGKKWVWCKRLLFFYLVNFAYGGFMFALWYFVSPASMTYRNGVAYFQISALTLAVSTIAAYLGLQVVGFFWRGRVRQEELAELTLISGGREVLLTAFVDSGNKLVDVITGLPVAVCELSAVKELFPPDVYEQLHKGKIEEITNKQYRFWLIPIQALSGSGLVVGFRPERCLVNGEEKQAVIGLSREKLSQGEFSALIGTTICLK